MANVQAALSVRVPASQRTADASAESRPVRVAADAKVTAVIARIARDHVELLTELAKR